MLQVIPEPLDISTGESLMGDFEKVGRVVVSAASFEGVIKSNIAGISRAMFSGNILLKS